MWRLGGGGASGRACVIPKNSEKCSFILNSMKMNGSDSRPPLRFVLPQLEQVRDCLLLRKKCRVYMIKFDVSNCYWSIVMPCEWRQIFSLVVYDEKFVWSILLLGLKYSPVICQRPISSFTSNVVYKLQVLPFTYLDDILVAGARRDLRRAVRRLKNKLSGAKFVVSPKLVLEPCTELDFVGKVFSTLSRMWSRKGMITVVVKGWLRIVPGCMTRKGMERFLGRLEWASRPQGGKAPFLSGAYRCKLTEGNRVLVALIRPLLTAITFVVLPRSFAFHGYLWRGPPHSVECNILLVDAAPRRKGGFRFGFLVPPRAIRSYKCCAWIDSLQQGELFAIIQVVKLAGYLKWGRVLVGSDSSVARHKVTGLCCALGLWVQSRLLRQLFWW